MKAKICLLSLKSIFGRNAVSHYSFHQLITKSNLFLDTTNQLRLSSTLQFNSLVNTSDKLLDRPEIQRFLKLVLDEYDRFDGPKDQHAPVLAICEKIKKHQSDLENLKTLTSGNDNEMQKLIDDEKTNLINEIQHLSTELIACAIPKDHDTKKLSLSVTPGLGGQEAKLFAEELFDMYLKYARYKGWDISHVERSNVDGGGISNAEATILGESVFSYLKHEAGVHRVQRVPITEKNGKMQTSTCKLHIIPDFDDCEIVLNKKDLLITTKTSSGPGGQHVNKNETCVRITYLPKGITVECQAERSQAGNRELALKKLKNILYQEQLEEKTSKMMDIKSDQAVTVKRSDKIRTYNFLQNRVTDHRINFTIHHIQKYMEGNKILDEMVSEVRENYQEESLIRNIAKMLENKSMNELFKNRTNNHDSN